MIRSRSPVVFSLSLAAWLGAAVVADPPPTAAAGILPAAERALIAEGRALFQAVGERVWPGWNAAPFSLILVVDEEELLLCPPAEVAGGQGAGFAVRGSDEILGCPVLARPRSFPPQLLATFPVVAAEPSIVIGTPAATGKSPTAWVVTLLHEHFHQLQMADAGYSAGVEALGLSGGDTTGMWMLNYPFPYGDPQVGERFSALALALANGLDAVGTPALAAAAARVEEAWTALRNRLAPADERYLLFQLWQEGVPRYVELRVAEAAAGREPAPEVRALPGYRSYGAVAADLRAQILDALRQPDLAGRQRGLLYPTGAAAALLLDAVHPTWKAQYLEHKFRFDTLLPPRASSSAPE